MKDLFSKLIKNPLVLNLLLAVFILCVLIYGTLKWLDHYTHHNEAVVVPDVKGLKIEDAATFFESNNLRYSVIDSVFSKNVVPGAIVEIVPAAGSKVKEGRIVFVTVNALTSQMGTIPQIEDLSLRQAYSILKARGFESIEVEYIPGDFKDLTIGLESKGRRLSVGEQVSLSESLKLIVSSGNGAPMEDSLDFEHEAPESLDNDAENWF